MSQLVIVRRDDALLHSYLQAQMGRSREIVVIQDRRVGERRQGPAHATVDGRKGDRRAPMALRSIREMKDLGFIAISPQGHPLTDRNA